MAEPWEISGFLKILQFQSLGFRKIKSCNTGLKSWDFVYHVGQRRAQIRIRI